MRRNKTVPHTYQHYGWTVKKETTYRLWSPASATGEPCQHTSPTLADARSWIDEQIKAPPWVEELEQELDRTFAGLLSVAEANRYDRPAVRLGFHEGTDSNGEVQWNFCSVGEDLSGVELDPITLLQLLRELPTYEERVNDRDGCFRLLESEHSEEGAFCREGRWYSSFLSLPHDCFVLAPAIIHDDDE